MLGYNRYRETKIKLLKVLVQKVVDVLKSKVALRIPQQYSCPFLDIREEKNLKKLRFKTSKLSSLLSSLRPTSV